MSPELDDGLRRAVLSSVREIRELKAALEEEKAKNAALVARVAQLEEELRERDSQPRSASASGAQTLPSPSPRKQATKSLALQRTGLRKPSPSFADDPSAAAPAPAPAPAPAARGTPRQTELILTYGAAVLVLRLLERGDAQRLGLTCRAWHAHCKQYLSEWRRTRLALELGDTERTYVQNMRGIVERYILPRTVGTKFLDDEEAFQLFANTEEIFQLNRAMYRLVRQVLLDWGAESCIGSVFEAFESAPELYRVYSSNQTTALAFAEQLRFELRIADNDWRLLESFLIQPIQRIPRYQMLLREVKQNTRDGHPEHAAIAKAQTLLTRVGSESICFRLCGCFSFFSFLRRRDGAGDGGGGSGACGERNAGADCRSAGVGQWHGGQPALRALRRGKARRWQEERRQGH